MENFGWATFLFASRWLLIGLVYVALFMVLLAVRREMSQRLAVGKSEESSAPARLRVLNPGSDEHMKEGDELDLHLVTRLGADKGNDIRLGDSYVSAYHASLRWDGASWWVEDLGSRNGTFVNETPVQPDTPTYLPPGGILRLGDTSFELRE